MSTEDIKGKRKASELTDFEAQLYDRGIRLWGVDAQKRIRESEILLIGLTAVNAEICKNLVLAGPKRVVILDGELTNEDDLGSNIFLTEEHLNKPRGESALANIQALNSLVKVEITDVDINNFQEAVRFFKKFKVVVISGFSFETLCKMNEACRKAKVYFFAVQNFGMFGYFFEDLIQFQYKKLKGAPVLVASDLKKTKIEDENKNNNNNNNNKNEEYEIKTVEYVPLEKALKKTPWKSPKQQSPLFAGIHLLYTFRTTWFRFPHPNSELDVDKLFQARKDIIQMNRYGEPIKYDGRFLTDDFVRALAQNASSSNSAVSAAVGGICAQEILKVTSTNDEPLNNTFFFTGLENEGKVECLDGVEEQGAPTYYY